MVFTLISFEVCDTFFVFKLDLTAHNLFDLLV